MARPGVASITGNILISSFTKLMSAMSITIRTGRTQRQNSSFRFRMSDSIL